MTARLSFQLPTDHELLRAPQRSQLATLRLALVLTERALLCNHKGLCWSTLPSADEPRALAVARMLLARVGELHALTDAYEQLLIAEPLTRDDEDDDIPF